MHVDWTNDHPLLLHIHDRTSSGNSPYRVDPGLQLETVPTVCKGVRDLKVQSSRVSWFLKKRIMKGTSPNPWRMPRIFYFVHIQQSKSCVMKICRIKISSAYSIPCSIEPKDSL